jgi:cytosine deaminase
MAFDIASAGGAQAMGIANYGLGVGCQSRLLLLPAENLAEAVVSRSLQRTVISNGRIVARDGAFVTHPV